MPSGNGRLAPIRAVLSQMLEAARVHVLDRRDGGLAPEIRHQREGVVLERHGTSAMAVVGIGDSTRNVIVVMTPSVPSEPMKRSIESMPGSAK